MRLCATYLAALRAAHEGQLAASNTDRVNVPSLDSEQPTKRRQSRASLRCVCVFYHPLRSVWERQTWTLNPLFPTHSSSFPANALWISLVASYQMLQEAPWADRQGAWSPCTMVSRFPSQLCLKGQAIADASYKQEDRQKLRSSADLQGAFSGLWAVQSRIICYSVLVCRKLRQYAGELRWLKSLMGSARHFHWKSRSQ